MSSPIDEITQLLECEEIITNGEVGAVFNHPKSGYVRLVKDYRKRSYVLEMYGNNSKLKTPNNQNNNILPSCTAYVCHICCIIFYLKKNGTLYTRLVLRFPNMM